MAHVSCCVLGLLPWAFLPCVLPGSPSYVVAKRNFRFHKLQRLQTYLSPVLFKISPLHLFFLLSFLHQEIILPGFCLLLHTSSVFFLSSCAARSPFAVIIPFCIPIPVFQGHLFHLSCLHLIPCRQVSSPVLFPLLFQALLQ